MRSLAATMRSAFAEAWSNRSGFWLQVSIMIVNDLVWVVFWVLFFREAGTVRGWDTQRVLLLQAILTTGGGIVLGFFNNARRLGQLAADGALDATLALPVPTLPHLLVRRVETTNLGDLIFGVALFTIACDPSWSRTAIYVAGSVIAAIILTGFLVAVGSLSFFFGRNEAGELGFHAMIMFASYPVDVFTGPGRAVLYSVIPAAFVASVPARLAESFDLSLALGMLGAAVAFATIGFAMFTLGLRRYTSGSAWTRA